MTLIGTSTIVFPKLENDDSAAKRKHVCSVCSRAFKRSEHCIRHQRGHTQEKPFGCRVCRRRYSRRDLLVRHERTLHAPEEVARATRGPQSGALKVGASANDSSPSTSIITAGEKVETTEPLKDHFVANFRKTEGRTTKAARKSTPGSSTSVPQAAAQYGVQAHKESPDRVGNTATTTADTSRDLSSNMDPRLTNFTVDVCDLERMRTFPASVPLPDLDGDLEFLDFFDPFLGISPRQVEAFTLPPLNEAGWSPLESFCSSGQTPLQDYNSAQNHTTLGETAPGGDGSAMWGTDLIATSQSSWQPLTWVDTSIPGSGTPPTSNEGTQALRQPQMRSAKHPALVFTDSMRARMLKDLSEQLSPEQLSDFRLPTASALQKCIRTYVDAFHVHLPIFHLQTIDFEHMPSPLILAICAIGAQYRLERKVSAALYLKADQALQAAIIDQDEHLHKKPRLLEDWVRPQARSSTIISDTLWKSQTRLLLAMLSCFSGDTEVVAQAIMHLGDFLMDFRSLAPVVRPRKESAETMTWPVWVERESIKRVLYGQIMFGNLVTMTYGIPPGYSVADGYTEMPCDQSLWDAPTEDLWREAALRKGLRSPLNVKDAVALVMNDDSTRTVPQQCWDWSPFTISVVINVISIHIWHITQGSCLFGGFSHSTYSGGNQKSQTLSQTEAALSRCRGLITQAKSDADYPWTEAETPLLFNCLALLRVSYCRAFTGHSAADSMMLLKETQEEFTASIEDFIALPQNRGDLVARAVGRAFEGMLIPSKESATLIKKTAALTWAVGHALAGWEVALLVTKWTHTIEHELRAGNSGTISEIEAQTMRSIEEFLTEIEDDVEEAADASLAAKLARYWASFYDETWVWSITPRMANVLRELAICYEGKI